MTEYQYKEKLSAGWHYWDPDRIYRYRFDSVPCIRKWRGGCGYYRYPRTFQERRKIPIFDKDERDMLTAPQINKLSRQRRELPDAWDDIPRHPWRRKSWKYYRDKQYHSKG